MIRTSKTGDWKKLEQVLAEAGKRFKKEIRGATNNAGRLMQTTMAGHIEGQNLPWKPLTPRYLAWKLKHGYSEQILFMTSSLMSGIKYHHGDWSGGFVGVSRNAVRKDGSSLANIAAVHEFGTRDGRVPARPFVAPTLKETEKEVVRLYQEAVERVFKGS